MAPCDPFDHKQNMIERTRFAIRFVCGVEAFGASIVH
jgi:hypothetical protein